MYVPTSGQFSRNLFTGTILPHSAWKEGGKDPKLTGSPLAGIPGFQTIIG